MDVILVIGRVLFAAIFIASGIAHIKQAEGMAGYAASKGVPSAKSGVILSGVFALVGGLSILLGVWPDLGAILIVLFLIPVSFFIHPFWKETDPRAKQAENANFMKNVALIGAAIVFFYFFNQAQDVPAGLISDPLFGRF